MTQPASILNSAGSQIDIIVDSAGNIRLKAATTRNTFTPSSLANVAAAAMVEIAGGGGALTDASGTITLGGTAQTALALNANRKYLLIQNLSATESLWVNFDGTAAVAGQPSIQLVGNGVFVWENVYIPTGAVSVLAATTSHPWTLKWA